MDFDDARYRERLARHFVQRRRIDLVAGDWDEERAFPKHETTRIPLPALQASSRFPGGCARLLSRRRCRPVGQGNRRLAYWGTLALMRCIGSSPAAGLSALRNRVANEIERLEPQIYDDDGDDEDAVDIEPAPGVEHADEALVRSWSRKPSGSCR